jgi:hypothetical protein
MKATAFAVPNQTPQHLLGFDAAKPANADHARTRAPVGLGRAGVGLVEGVPLKWHHQFHESHH